MIEQKISTLIDKVEKLTTAIQSLNALIDFDELIADMSKTDNARHQKPQLEVAASRNDEQYIYTHDEVKQMCIDIVMNDLQKKDIVKSILREREVEKVHQLKEDDLQVVAEELSKLKNGGVV